MVRTCDKCAGRSRCDDGQPWPDLVSDSSCCCCSALCVAGRLSFRKSSLILECGDESPHSKFTFVSPRQATYRLIVVVRRRNPGPVSYTHLTLPTSDLV